MAIKKVKSVKLDEQEPETVEIIAKAIIDIGDGVRKMQKSRLTRRAIIVLIHDSCNGVGKPAIKVVLDCLDDLENTYIKGSSRGK